jgi:hypothetical protein
LETPARIGYASQIPLAPGIDARPSKRNNEEKRDEEGAIVASIGISAPVTRFPTSRYTVTARHVSDAARKIGASLRV